MANQGVWLFRGGNEYEQGKRVDEPFGDRKQIYEKEGYLMASEQFCKPLGMTL
jgi:hypothetical protein